MFSTNPNLQFHAPGSKEDIELNKGAITNFKPANQYALKTENAFNYASDLKQLAIEFGYHGTITKVATVGTVNEPDEGEEIDPASLTLGDFKNLLTSWNDITPEAIQNNATVTWGDKTWTETREKEIVPFSHERGELANAGRLTNEGKQKFMTRRKLVWLAHHAISMIVPEDRPMINVNDRLFLWSDPMSGDIVKDGLTVLYLVFNKLRPNVRVDVYAELKVLKEKTHPTDFKYDMIKWLSTMQRKRNELNEKLSNAYSLHDWLNDVLTIAQEVPNKKYAAKVDQIKQEWNLDEIVLTEDLLVRKRDKLYKNNKQGWAEELSKHDQVLALTTTLESQGKEIEELKRQRSTPVSDQNTHPQGRKPPFVVKPWRLKYKGEEVEVEGRKWYWCTKDHWSDGVKYNGMYCDHTTEEHDSWRKEKDADKNKRFKAREEEPTIKVIKGPNEKPSSPDAKGKKLALSNSLQSVLTTEYGLTPDQFNHMWNQCCSESGN